MLDRNHVELEQLFKVVDFEPVEHWCDPPIPVSNGINTY